MMSTIFLNLTVGLLVLLFVRSSDASLPPLPHSGKIFKDTLINYILIIIQESNCMEDIIKRPTQMFP